MKSQYASMADTGIFCTGTEVERKAGKNANTTSKGEDYTNDYIAQAESVINNVCRFNFSDTYSTLNDDTRQLLKQVASDLAAIYVINYDMSGYSSRIEAEDMINVLRDSALRGLSLLRDKKVSDFISGS